MGDRRICTFTDTYLPTLNGVTYTVEAWRDHWRARGGEMSIVHPASPHYQSRGDEFPVRSVPFPFYDGFRVALPLVPRSLSGADVVHAHTPFSLGLAALRYRRRNDLPLVASYHTPTGEYTTYLASFLPLARALSSISTRYERWFFDRADVVTAPTAVTADRLRDALGLEVPVRVVSNGVDLEMFAPIDPAPFRERHDLPDGPLIGYTGRHGHEKRLEDLVEAVAAGPTDWSIVLGGTGPATEHLRRLAATRGVTARFLGVLDRDDLPGFYSAIDVFAFPSPVETQGIVALESIACGTPVVGVDSGALVETITEGVTGYVYPVGDRAAFTDAIARALADRDALVAGCLDRREELSIDASLEALDEIYRSLA